MWNYVIKLSIVSLGFLLNANVLAGNHQSHESIRAAAASHMTALTEAQYDGEVAIEAGRLDTRLKLHPCEQPLETFLPSGARETGNTTVGVRCSDSKPWTLYVPVRVSIYAQVVVAARSMTKGIVTINDLKLARRDQAKLSQGYLTELSQAIGKKLKRNLMPGKVLTPAMLDSPRLVSRGQRVILIAGAGGLEVRMPGKALAHGSVGERIRVQNISSKKVVEGVITASGAVSVGT